MEIYELHLNHESQILDSKPYTLSPHSSYTYQLTTEKKSAKGSMEHLQAQLAHELDTANETQARLELQKMRELSALNRKTSLLQVTTLCFRFHG